MNTSHSAGLTGADRLSLPTSISSGAMPSQSKGADFRLAGRAKIQGIINDDLVKSLKSPEKGTAS